MAGAERTRGRGVRAWFAMGFVLAASFSDVARAASAGAPADSVYSVSWSVDAPLIAAGAVGSLIPGLLSEDLIRRRCPCDPSEVNSFDRGVIGNRNPFLENLSDASVATFVAGPILLDYLALGASRAFAEDLVIFAEVLALNSGLVTLAKYTVQRPVPRAYSGELADRPEGYRSFYSGHTSNAFAALSAASMTYTLRYGASPWPWVATFVLGGSVAAERIAAGRHFYTDVITGAAVGSAIGILVPWLHRRQEGQSARFHVMAAPAGPMLAWRAEF